MTLRSNLDIVREFIDAFNRGDVEGFVAYTAEDVEMVEAPEYPGATSRHGHAGVRETLASWSQVWGRLTTTMDEMIEVDEERVLTLGRQRARGGSGGVEIEAFVAALYRIREGRVVSMHFFLDEAQARAAAGLG
ncbi:MAG TPA: nuclear transport factor 2 family protein [Solirubrobacteraceae bacterium]|nr:nuclear transport factor 2 family protein [Solirubrobacteraceae bacterium]